MITLERGEEILKNLSDGTLARKALEGEDQAFEALIKRYSSYLFCFILRLLGDYDRACDVHQQVLIQLYHSLGTLEQDRPLKAWLFRVAHNRCIDMMRSKHAYTFTECEKAEEDESEILSIIDNDTQPATCLEQSDLRNILLNAIDNLPQHYQQIVLLRYLSQLTFPEIGKLLSLPATTAKTYFHRACPMLREILGIQTVYELLPD